MPGVKHPIPTHPPDIQNERLRLALGDPADERPERYSFTWTGKRDALRLL